MPRPIDALFISYFANMDRWHNDADADCPPPSLARTRSLLTALADDTWMKDEIDVVIDGELHDFSRFLSRVRYGTTEEHGRYDPFNITLLAGSYYLDLLERHGYEVRAANVADRRRLGRIASDYEPRFVLLSTTLLFDAADHDIVRDAVRHIRRQWPGAVIVLGGLMLVSYEKNLPRQVFHGLLRTYGADVYVISPGGEDALLEILRRGSVDAVVDGPRIPGVYVVSGGTVIEPGAAPTGAPALASPIRWRRLAERHPLYHMVHMRTARSCAFKCAFCEYPVNQGPLALAPLEVVDEELRELAAVDGVRSIVFTDDTFNVPVRRFHDLMRILARYDFEWYSFFRPQYADAETARLMKAAGCRAVFAGLESVDDTVLRNMDKVATADQYRRGIEQLQRQGISVHANFIVGFPGETERSARKIAPFIDELGIDFCTVCVWAFIPSTPIGRRAAEFGLEGMGMQWRHATMRSGEAQALAREVVTDQRSAVHNAVRGEAWTEFLLYGNGFTVDEARLAIGTFNSWLGRDVGAAELETAGAQALRRALQAHEMPPPAGWA